MPRTRRALNFLMRLSIVYFLLEALLRPNDPRYAHKVLPVQSFVGVGGLTLIFPFLHLLAKRLRPGGAGHSRLTRVSPRLPRVIARWRHYPFWLDNLYLSIFWLDMVGNSFNLYNRYYHFDILPHFHGAGALAVLLQRILRLPALTAVGLANVIHLYFEAGENYLDAFHGLNNVRGPMDVVKDLLMGLTGTVVYSTTYTLLRKRGWFTDPGEEETGND